MIKYRSLVWEVLDVRDDRALLVADGVLVRLLHVALRVARVVELP